MTDFLIRVGPPCLFAFAGAFALASLWHDGRRLLAYLKEASDAVDQD